MPRVNLLYLKKFVKHIILLISYSLCSFNTSLPSLRTLQNILTNILSPCIQEKKQSHRALASTLQHGKRRVPSLSRYLSTCGQKFFIFFVYLIKGWVTLHVQHLQFILLVTLLSFTRTIRDGCNHEQIVLWLKEHIQLIHSESYN